MQLVLPWLVREPRVPRAENAPSVLTIGPHSFPIAITRHRRARRYVLRMTPDGGLRLTVPRGASVAGGLAFAQGQGAWVAREQARRQVRLGAWSTGTLVWFRGAQIPVVLEETRLTFASEVVLRPKGTAHVREVFDAHLRRLATTELPGRCAELAQQHGLTVSRVSIRNQRSRWGSCSSRGAIALNWRLIQMPPDVCDYVILHELMHLRQPNHSRQFWREVAAVCDGWRDAERWLKRHGRELL